MAQGILALDFIDGPLKDLGQNVTHEVATKTVSNITGDRTLAYASGVTIKAVFLRRNRTRKYNKEGVVEKGDAYIMAKPTDNVTRNDRITVGGVIYRVEAVIKRNPDGATKMFHMCTLFLL